MSISKQIIDVIDTLCEKFGIVIDWTADNVLPYIQSLCKKFIEYEINTSIFWIAFMSSLCVLLWTITLIAYRIYARNGYGECPSAYVAYTGFIVSIVLSFITIIIIGVEVYDIVEAVNFPEKSIYDYISKKLSSQSVR